MLARSRDLARDEADTAAAWLAGDLTEAPVREVALGLRVAVSRAGTGSGNQHARIGPGPDPGRRGCPAGL